MSNASSDNTHLSHLLESTPSQETKETPGWARLIGLIGKVCFSAGVLMYLWNTYAYVTILKGPSFKEGTSTQQEPWLFSFVILFILLGVIGMLIQASRERDTHQRRLLGIVGIVIFVLGVLFLTNVLVGEGVRTWLLTGAEKLEEAARERINSQGRWAGLVASIFMSLILLVAWVAPFVRASMKGSVSFFQLFGAWMTKLGEARVSACTLFGGIALVILTGIAFLLKDPLSTYSDLVLLYLPDNRLAYGLCSYAVLMIVVGTPFMLIFSRTEEDAAWQRVPAVLFVTVGTIAAVFGLVGVFTDLIKVPDYTLPYGLGLAALGLICLGLYVAQRGGDSETGYDVAKWLGYAGSAVFVVAAFRSILPNLVEVSWLQDWFPSLEEVNLPSYLVPNGFLYLVLGGAFALMGWTLASENRLLVLTRKELGSSFTSPIGYVVLGGTVVAAWVSYWVWLSDLAEPRGMLGTPEPVVLSYFFGIFPVIFLIVAVPMLTMRLVSEEHRTGTMEVLLTAPVSELNIILSKFLATWIFYLFCWIIWMAFPLILRVAGQESFDYRPLLSVMLGLGAMGFGFIGMGLFFSSLTKNQIVAFLLTFAGMFAWIMVYFVQFFISSGSAGGSFRPETTNTLIETVRYASFIDHLLAFSRGSVYFKNILFHVSLGCFWLFVTVKVLESRKWR
jgi:ABC-2 type transport system permease protein